MLVRVPPVGEYKAAPVKSLLSVALTLLTMSAVLTRLVGSENRRLPVTGATVQCVPVKSSAPKSITHSPKKSSATLRSQLVYVENQ